MRSLNLLHWAGALALAFSIGPGRAVAQDALSITGNYRMSGLSGTVGADLAGVQPNSAERWWKLTASGVSYSHFLDTYDDGWEYSQYLSTRVHATSFTIEFFGPDAAILNEVVSRQLTQGGVADGAVLELVNVYSTYANGFGEAWSYWNLRLEPAAPWMGVSFWNYGYSYLFAADELGYPLVQPQRLWQADSSIYDYRPGNNGSLWSNDDIVDIGSDQQPVPPPPQIVIWDASAREGDRGTTTLLMKVSLNRASDQIVTVQYQTAGGTAVAGVDYVAKSGLLGFQPGETAKTISISIIGDRKREANETIGVALNSAVGAVIARSVGVATILNDD